MAGRMRAGSRSERRFNDGAHEALQRAALIRRALSLGTELAADGDQETTAAAG
jgi:hypothetical protein